MTLLDGPISIGTALVDNTGIWSVTSSPLAAGSHTLTTTETDSAGNVSAPFGSLVLTIDTASPETRRQQSWIPRAIPDLAATISPA